MITGFNTDVEFNGVTYHVQTEDKGLDTPLILSLVYDRGTILASKRSPYDDLLLGKFNENELAERLQRQHKLICAAIRAGRLEDLKRMNNSKQAAQKTESAQKIISPKQPSFVIEKEIEIKPQAEFKFPLENGQNKVVIAENNHPGEEVRETAETIPSPQQFLGPIQKPDIELPQPAPKIDNQPEFIDAPIEITDADLIFDESENITDIQEIIVVPEGAVEIVTDFFEPETRNGNQLLVQLMNENQFKGGESKTVSILVCRGKTENALVGANVIVKILGSNFRPLIFHTKTDSNGVAIINIQLPSFSRGRAAILIKAMNNGDEAELRRVIHPN